MTSLLNLFGTSALYANVIMKLTNNDNFVNLISDINENGLAEYNERFIVKAMYEVFDPVVIPFLQTDENKSLFNNSKLSKETKIKTCVVKLVTHMYNTYAADIEKNFGVQMMKSKAEFIKDISAEFCTHINMNKVNDCNDVYKILLEFYGLQFSNNLTMFIALLTNKLDGTLEEKFYTSVDNITKKVNDTYVYTPYLYRNTDNNDNSDSDSDGDNDNNSQNESNKNNLDNNNDNDDNDNTTDSKKRRNE